MNKLLFNFSDSSLAHVCGITGLSTNFIYFSFKNLLHLKLYATGTGCCSPLSLTSTRHRSHPLLCRHIQTSEIAERIHQTVVMNCVVLQVCAQASQLD